MEPKRRRITNGVIVSSALVFCVGLADVGQALSTPDRSSPYVVSWNRTLPTEMRFSCLNKTIGGQRGWRLPSIVELTSLLDPSVQDSGSMLPSGHPFLNNPSGFYWSASADGESSKAWHLHLSNGHVHMTGKASTFKAWCVRGASTGAQ